MDHSFARQVLHPSGDLHGPADQLTQGEYRCHQTGSRLIWTCGAKRINLVWTRINLVNFWRQTTPKQTLMVLPKNHYRVERNSLLVQKILSGEIKLFFSLLVKFSITFRKVSCPLMNLSFLKRAFTVSLSYFFLKVTQLKVLMSVLSTPLTLWICHCFLQLSKKLLDICLSINIHVSTLLSYLTSALK